jgi:L-ascorbate metabolism protein UlaG (beta-lactamase superfamily)
MKVTIKDNSIPFVDWVGFRNKNPGVCFETSGGGVYLIIERDNKLFLLSLLGNGNFTEMNSGWMVRVREVNLEMIVTRIHWKEN